MFKRLKNNFDNGLEKIKWFSSLLSERLKIEFSVFKLLYQSYEMERKKDELMKTVGHRIYELRDQHERHMLKDRAIMETLHAIDKINQDIEDTKKKASEISTLES